MITWSCSSREACWLASPTDTAFKDSNFYWYQTHSGYVDRYAWVEGHDRNCGGQSFDCNASNSGRCFNQAINEWGGWVSHVCTAIPTLAQVPNCQPETGIPTKCTTDSNGVINVVESYYRTGCSSGYEYLCATPMEFRGSGAGYYRASASGNSYYSYTTPPLTKDTTYNIAGLDAVAYDSNGNMLNDKVLRASVTVKVVPKSFKISSSKNSLTATIVDGLSANSDSAVLTITNTTNPARSINVTLGASLVSGLSGTPVFSYGGTDYNNSAVISLTAGELKNVSFKVKSIPGSTNAGNYNITVNSSAGTFQKTTPITLKVEKITTDWKEF